MTIPMIGPLADAETKKNKNKLKHRWRDLIFLSNVMLCVSASKCHHAISEKSVKQVWFQTTKISRRFC